MPTDSNAKHNGMPTAVISVTMDGTSKRRAMKQLTLVVRPVTAEAVLKAIGELEVNACLVQEAKGFSRQKGYLERYRGSEYSMAFLPKVEISVFVQNQRVQEVADKIM